MVVVKIELWPYGIKERAREIGRLNIVNDGSGDTRIGHYKVEVKHGGIFSGKEGNWKTGVVKNHKRILSPYHLVYRAIKNALNLK